MPLPPSVNKATSNHPEAGRIRTAAYKRWFKAAGQQLMAQKPGLAAKALGQGFYRVRIRVSDGMAGDVDNRAKLIVDFLHQCHVTPDDQHLWHLSIGRSRQVAPGTCSISVWSCSR